jgi:murein hydrolase activator
MRRPLLLLLLAGLAGSGAAQDVRQEARALAAAKQAAAAAEARSRALEARAADAADAAARARAEAVATAARVQAAEAEIAVAQTRLALVEQLRARQRARLAARQGAIVRLTSALEVMARRPSSLALVQPGSVADMVHVRALLASTVPIVRARTAGLRAELAEARRLEAQAGVALKALQAGQANLQQQRLALLRLEGRERLRSQAFSESAALESERALGLGERARDIADLMRTLDSQAEIRARLASLPGPLLRPAVPGQAPPPPERAPDAAPAAPPPYKLPVAGRVVSGLGEIADSGVRSRGLTIAAAAGAQVVAPSGGRVSYAGAFRGYGLIVIIDHGGGWTTLVTGLGTVSVAAGGVVERGSPIGTASGRASGVAVELRRRGQPVDITRLAVAI